MRHILFRTTVPALAVMALLGAGSTAAFANDCFNPSRNPTPTGGATVIPLDSGDVVYIQGHWVNYDGQGWGKVMPGTQNFMGSGISFNGNYTNGASDELGGRGARRGTGFCSAPNRDYTTGNLHGIQVPEGCHWAE